MNAEGQTLITVLKRALARWARRETSVSWGLLLTRFWRQSRGVVAIETAFALPVFLVLTLASADVYRYISLKDEVRRAASTVADYLSRKESYSEQQVADALVMGADIAQSSGGRGAASLVLSAVTRSGTTSSIAWQRRFDSSSDGQTATSCKRIGDEGASPGFLSGFSLLDGETVIVAEVCFLAAGSMFLTDELFSTLVVGEELYSHAVYRTRHDFVPELM
ncbi:TadE/TadG family type IV pilus assembly protein [Rhodovibrionaceae bacterium A322]